MIDEHPTDASELVEVTVERRRSLVTDQGHLMPGEKTKLPLSEARAAEVAGFIKPLDGSEREAVNETHGVRVTRDGLPGRVIEDGVRR